MTNFRAVPINMQPERKKKKAKDDAVGLNGNFLFIFF